MGGEARGYLGLQVRARAVLNKLSDASWFKKKVRNIFSYAEPLPGFMAFVPGERCQQTWPSTVAYMARPLIDRYAMLGALDKGGYPITDLGVMESPAGSREREGLRLMKGTRCRGCGNLTVIRKDGCDFCSACGWVGVCG